MDQKQHEKRARPGYTQLGVWVKSSTVKKIDGIKKRKDLRGRGPVISEAIDLYLKELRGSKNKT